MKVIILNGPMGVGKTAVDEPASGLKSAQIHSPILIS
jgi:tRNA A37 threonylcarbamoyladenosine biosynthesis protein TsaE